MEDAIYLQLAVANKYRFLATADVDSSRVVRGSTGALEVTVRLIAERTLPETPTLWLMTTNCCDLRLDRCWTHLGMS